MNRLLLKLLIIFTNVSGFHLKTVYTEVNVYSGSCSPKFKVRHFNC